MHHFMCTPVHICTPYYVRVFTLAIHTIVFLFSRPPSLAVGRLGVAPFTCARDLLSPLPAELKPGRTDLLHQCHQLAAEVVHPRRRQALRRAAGRAAGADARRSEARGGC